MKIFTVNKEFGVWISSSTFYLHKGDIVWVNDTTISYIEKVEYQFPEFNGNPSGRKIFYLEKGRNTTVWCDKTLKIKSVQNLIDEKFIHDITISYERDEKLEKWID